MQAIWLKQRSGGTTSAWLHCTQPCPWAVMPPGSTWYNTSACGRDFGSSNWRARLCIAGWFPSVGVAWRPVVGGRGVSIMAIPSSAYAPMTSGPPQGMLRNSRISANVKLELRYVHFVCPPLARLSALGKFARPWQVWPHLEILSELGELARPWKV